LPFTLLPRTLQMISMCCPLFNLPSMAEAVESIRSLQAATKTLASAVEPLQGTAERLGRISDRLIGGRRG